jgi:hypothetical protein
MAVEAAGQPTTMLFPPAEQFGTELSILELGTHFRADLHASARPFQDRLIALAALWTNTDTGKKVLTQAQELEATGNRIKFQAQGELLQAPEQPTETVLLKAHLLDIGATEVGVPPDVDHSCELMKSVVTALNALSARVTPSEASHVGEPMDAEQLASQLRKELKGSNDTSKAVPPARPPLPNPALIAQSLQQAAGGSLQQAAAVGADSGPEVLAGLASMPPAPDEADKPAPYSPPTETAPAPARKRWGLPWIRRRANDAVASLRMLFQTRHEPAGEGGETLVKKSGKKREKRPVETAIRKESMTGQAPDRRHSAPSTVASVLELLKRDSKEIEESPIAWNDGGQKTEEARSPAQDAFKRKHRRTASGVWGRLKSALPGGKARQQTSYQELPGTRENSLSVPNTPKSSISESASKRPSIVSQQSLKASAAEALVPEAPVPEAPVQEETVPQATIPEAPMPEAPIPQAPVLEAPAAEPAATP